MRRSLYAICLTLLLAGCRQAAVQPVQGILTEPASWSGKQTASRPSRTSAADGGALDYEGMPDLEATVTWAEDGFALSNLQVVE